MFCFPFGSYTLEIEECPNCECDSFSTDCAIYYGRLWCSAGRCGRFSSHYLNNDNRFQGTKLGQVIWTRNVNLRLKTDNSVHYSGIKISFIAASYSGKLLLRSYFILIF